MDSMLREQNQRLLRENRALQADIQALRRELHEQSRRVPEYEVALGKSQKRCTELLAELDKEKEKAISMVALLNSREARYTKQDELLRSLQVDLETLRQELQTIHEAYSLAISERDAFQQSRDNADKEIEQLREDKGKAEGEALRAREELNFALRSKEDLQRHLDIAIQDLASLRKSVELEKRELQIHFEAKLTREREAHSETIRKLREGGPVYTATLPTSTSSYVYSGPIPTMPTMPTVPTMSTGMPGGNGVTTTVTQTQPSSYSPTHRHRHHHHESTTRSKSPVRFCPRLSSDDESKGMAPVQLEAMMKEYRHGFMDALSTPACVGLSSSNHTNEYSGTQSSSGRRFSVDGVSVDAPNLRRQRKGIGALPVDRNLDGDLIATCRRRHCLRRFNVNDNAASTCGYHPVKPHTSYDGDYYSCCGVLVRPGAPNIYCQFRPHLA